MAEAGMLAPVTNDFSLLISDDPFNFRLDDEDGLKRMMGWLEALKPRLVFLDPLRDFHSVEEKDSGPMNRLLRPLQQWAKKEAGGNVTTDQFIALAERVSGQDLGDLFDVWLFEPSKPALPVVAAAARSAASSTRGHHAPAAARAQLQRYGRP